MNFAEANFLCDKIEFYDQTSTKIYPTDLTEIWTQFCLFVKLDTIGRLSQRKETHVVNNGNKLDQQKPKQKQMLLTSFCHWTAGWTEFCFYLDWPLVPGRMYVFVFFVTASLKKRKNVVEFLLIWYWPTVNWPELNFKLVWIEAFVSCEWNLKDLRVSTKNFFARTFNNSNNFQFANRVRDFICSICYQFFPIFCLFFHGSQHFLWRFWLFRDFFFLRAIFFQHFVVFFATVHFCRRLLTISSLDHYQPWHCVAIAIFQFHSNRSIFLKYGHMHSLLLGCTMVIAFCTCVNTITFSFLHIIFLISWIFLFTFYVELAFLDFIYNFFI